MPPSTGQNGIKPTPEIRRTYRPLRLGKSLSGLPIRGRRSSSNASIWLLAICIAIALLLRTISDAESLEIPLGYLPDKIRNLPAAEAEAYNATGARAQLLSFATGFEVVALSVDMAADLTGASNTFV